MTTMALNNAINGLIRTSALRRTRLVEPYRGSDTGPDTGTLRFLANFGSSMKHCIFVEWRSTSTASPGFLGSLVAPLSAAQRAHAPARQQAAPRPAPRRDVGANVRVRTSRTLLFVAKRSVADRRTLANDLRAVSALPVPPYLTRSIGLRSGQYRAIPRARRLLSGNGCRGRA